MDWFLKRKLTQLGDRANPEPGFVRSLEKTLQLQSGHRSWWIHWGRIAASASSIVLVAATATSAYAYTSDDVLPDSALYPVRQSLENVETAVAPTPIAKAKVEVKHLKRRMREAELLVAKRKPISPQVEQQVSEKIHQASEEAKELPAKEQAEINTELTQIQAEREQLKQRPKETRSEIRSVNQEIRKLEHEQKREVENKSLKN